MLQTKRIYDPASPDDDRRYLVDRVWPRGVSRDKAALAGWLKALAPSHELRVWFNHEPSRWDEFKRRYLLELASSGQTGPADPEIPELIARLLGEAGKGTVTLLFAARDTEHNNAVALKGFLESGAI
jgi:uncharacterized protein YeaO (DUF488 family)